MYEVKNKVILVTGAAAGIGAEVTKQFLNEGAQFVAILDVDVEKGSALEKELTTKHGAARVKFYKCNVTNSDQLNKCYEDVLKTCGTIDVVVNNAAILNDENYKAAVAVNVTALMDNSFIAYNMMRKDRGGKGGAIINVASVASLMNLSFSPVYSATKSAVLQFSLCLGAEENYSRSGVRVLAVCFGLTDTTIFAPEKCSFFDKEMQATFDEKVVFFPTQTAESAAKGLVEAYKFGESASTWLVESNLPAKEITATVTQAYEITKACLEQRVPSA